MRSTIAGTLALLTSIVDFGTVLPLLARPLAAFHLAEGQTAPRELQTAQHHHNRNFTQNPHFGHTDSHILKATGRIRVPLKRMQQVKRADLTAASYVFTCVSHWRGGRPVRRPTVRSRVVCVGTGIRGEGWWPYLKPVLR